MSIICILRLRFSRCRFGFVLLYLPLFHILTLWRITFGLGSAIDTEKKRGLFLFFKKKRKTHFLTMGVLLPPPNSQCNNDVRANSPRRCALAVGCNFNILINRFDDVIDEGLLWRRRRGSSDPTRSIEWTSSFCRRHPISSSNPSSLKVADIRSHPLLKSPTPDPVTIFCWKWWAHLSFQFQKEI